MTIPLPAAAPSVSSEARRAVTILNTLAQRLTFREQKVRERIGMYQGKHTLRYASPEFASYFGERFKGFVDNWCAPVINGPVERMNVLGIRPDDTEKDLDSTDVDQDLTRAWRTADGQRGSSEAFVVGLSAAHVYGLVWGDPDDDTPTLSWLRPDQAILEYDGDTGKRVAGLRLWRDDAREYATLYQPDAVWKFARRANIVDGRTEAGIYVPPGSALGGWEPRRGSLDASWPLPNPIGEVPLIELRNQTLLDGISLSDLDGVASMQDAINLIWAYLMNALDFASLPQRIVTGSDVPTTPVLDKDGNVIGRRPIELDLLIRERILWIPGATAKTSEWTAANLDVFSKVIEHAVEHVAAQTRTPPHYLIGRVANLAAEALTAAETGLVAKTGERIVYYTPGIRDIFRLMALAADQVAKAKAIRSGTVVWADTQFRALGQKVDAIQKLKACDFPFEWLCEQYGMDPPEVARVLAMRERDAQRDPLGQVTKALGQLGDQPDQPAVGQLPAAPGADGGPGQDGLWPARGAA